MAFRLRPKQELGKMNRLDAREAARLLDVSAAAFTIYTRSGIVPMRRKEQRPGRGSRRRWFTMDDVFSAAILRTMRLTCGLRSVRTEARALATLRSGDPDRLARFLLIEVDPAFADQHFIDGLATGGRGGRFAVLEHATNKDLRVLDQMMEKGVVHGVTTLATIVSELDDKLDELIRKGQVVYEREQ